MSKIDLKGSLRALAKIVNKNSPEILTGIGIAGMLTTVVLAVRATPKATEKLDDLREEYDGEKVPPMEFVKKVGPGYVPAIVTGVASTACLIGATSINSRRNAALITAYQISTTALSEYKDKVIETIGENKEREVRDSIAKDKIEKNPVKNNTVIVTDKGETLCYDTTSGRYFKSDIHNIRKTVEILNKNLRDDMYVSLNDFYSEIGLPEVSIGEDLGWNMDDGYIEIDFSSQLSEDERPCLVLEFNISPRYDFRQLY